ncbi:electron transfer flavoprotein subunit alpha/FixB family protein [Georgenia sp. Z1344]|uniref:electron transfer flavoprotein subunit alpha/FixB family protein n=1 Tax=Georgenia sp. Z1344 TaxID=3416706 RepID=UPI003CE7D5E4
MTALVLLETAAAAPTPDSLALLALARTLDAGDVAAVASAPAAEHDALAAAAAAAGADVVALAPSPDADVLVSPLVDALAGAVELLDDVTVVLAPATPDAREAAGRLAVRLGVAPLWGADTVTRQDDGSLSTKKSVAWNQWVVSCVQTGGTAVVVVDPSLVAPASGPGAGRRVELPAPTSLGAAVIGREVAVTDGGRPAITEADVVVAGGLGVGSGEQWPIVEELADALGAAVGATRSAVDEGWVPFAAQIGQTGEVVAPRFYIGLGISGAVQHTSGMQRSGTIVVVNDDEDSPMFELADLGVLGDLHEVVPALLEALRARG